MSMKLRIVLDDRDHAILVGDEDNNDIAEFYHSDHATVSQSYETALALAKQLVAGCGAHAQTSRTQELERRVLAHEHLQARIVHALGRDTWQGDLAVAVEAEVNRANDNGKSCSEAFKVLRTIQDSAAEMLRMPWLQAPSLPSTPRQTAED